MKTKKLKLATYNMLGVGKASLNVMTLVPDETKVAVTVNSTTVPRTVHYPNYWRGTTVTNAFDAMSSGKIFWPRFFESVYVTRILIWNESGSHYELIRGVGTWQSYYTNDMSSYDLVLVKKSYFPSLRNIPVFDGIKGKISVNESVVFNLSSDMVSVNFQIALAHLIGQWTEMKVSMNGVGSSKTQEEPISPRSMSTKTSEELVEFEQMRDSGLDYDNLFSRMTKHQLLTFLSINRLSFDFLRTHKDCLIRNMKTKGIIVCPFEDLNKLAYIKEVNFLRNSYLLTNPDRISSSCVYVVSTPEIWSEWVSTWHSDNYFAVLVPDI